jgi:intein/homing endonuclease
MDYIINEDLAEETGIHTGDGSMNIYKNSRYFYTVACHKEDDREYVDSVILPLIKRIYGKTPKPRNWSKGTYGFRICSKNIVEFKNQMLGLPLGKKNNINIPEVFYVDKRLMQHFLRGLFDTDGSLCLWKRRNRLYPRIYLSNISRELVQQVRAFLVKEGFRVTYWKTKYESKKWNDLHRISINGTDMLTRWVDTIGFKNPKNIKKLNLLGVKRKIL